MPSRDDRYGKPGFGHLSRRFPWQRQPESHRGRGYPGHGREIRETKQDFDGGLCRAAEGQMARLAVVLNEERRLFEDKAPALMGVAGYDGFYGDRF